MSATIPGRVPSPSLSAGPDAHPRAVSIAVDAMGGDQGPLAAVRGAAIVARTRDDVRFAFFGHEAELRPLINAEPSLAGRSALHHCDGVVGMEEPPVQALRRGRDSSMWRALDVVAAGDADAAVSAGNTGALMTMALVRLRAAPGVDRPAIAALWPSQGAAGFNVVLDVGANLRAEARDLCVNALLGVEYARIALGIETPRVALLNVGSEEMKGRPEIREASDRLIEIARASKDAQLAFVGFVEGDRIAEDDADVIVTDGFTGNVALKTAEGTASLFGALLREALARRWTSRLGALLAGRSLLDFKRRTDPRRVNGGVFLGLNGVVVKSHGAADPISFAAALDLAARMGRRGISARIAAQVAYFAPAQHTHSSESSNSAAAGSG